jgi:hypothetical protein
MCSETVTDAYNVLPQFVDGVRIAVPKGFGVETSQIFKHGLFIFSIWDEILFKENTQRVEIENPILNSPRQGRNDMEELIQSLNDRNY